uniref:Insulin-like domain-containing protein n=1 Tax=Panagrolaimus sp. JU765 TaxID=591449 RepID=A0AC34QFQ0_9BILA
MIRKSPSWVLPTLMALALISLFFVAAANRHHKRRFCGAVFIQFTRHLKSTVDCEDFITELKDENRMDLFDKAAVNQTTCCDEGCDYYQIRSIVCANFYQKNYFE